jgi:two-component system sensor histidine kinase UhpB
MRERLSPDVELVLYRVAQEALTNIAKHARATRVTISLDRSTSGVALTVRDNGIGFDQGRFFEGDGVGLGLGLFGMEERVTLLGGKLGITSRPGHGSAVRAEIPLGTDKEM